MAGKSINYGEYAFLGGILLAFIIGVLSSVVPSTMVPVVMALLFVLGTIVGLVNIREKEANSFLIATIAILVAATSWNALLGGTLALLGTAGTTLADLVIGFVQALVVFISPAAFIVALKAVYNLAKPD